jgi:hypothetical protein
MAHVFVDKKSMIERTSFALMLKDYFKLCQESVFPLCVSGVRRLGLHKDFRATLASIHVQTTFEVRTAHVIRPSQPIQYQRHPLAAEPTLP